MSNEERVINFFPGPSALPAEVLQTAAKEMLNYKGLGYGVMEMSHRSKEFVQICDNAEQDIRDLMSIPDNYKIMFLQGGCTGMFAAVALNFLEEGKSADYLVTGTWSDKAVIEAEKYGKVNRIFPKQSKYTTIPPKSEWKFNKDASYVYYCSNETIGGIEFHDIPETNGVPLICDMSSNIMTRKFDVTKFACIVAGAQKLLGPAGVAIVIVREDMLGKERKECPTIWNFKKQVAMESRLNTPPCYSIYITGLVLNWMKRQGGVQTFEERNARKAKLFYDTMENSKSFYSAIIDPCARSRVNIPFRVGQGDENLESKFVAEAKSQGLDGLAGHRSVGGCRASIYNTLTYEDVERLTGFMKEFQLTNQN
ncbi:phosphoserine aminotransferase-like [Rhopilema esculentum]|uniref:phosphoserine aminotransferase-like n=1 Tax=Rhopilema esculentum TaxID=499914 RepID=UPI0031D3DA19